MKTKPEYRIEEREIFSLDLMRSVKKYEVSMKTKSCFLRREIWETVGDWRGCFSGAEVPICFSTKAEAQAYIKFYSK